MSRVYRLMVYDGPDDQVTSIIDKSINHMTVRQYGDVKILALDLTAENTFALNPFVKHFADTLLDEAPPDTPPDTYRRD